MTTRPGVGWGQGSAVVSGAGLQAAGYEPAGFLWSAPGSAGA